MWVMSPTDEMIVDVHLLSAFLHNPRWLVHGEKAEQCCLCGANAACFIRGGCLLRNETAV